MASHVVSRAILEQYERHVLELPWAKIGHFFLRAYRMTGDAKYCPMLAAYFQLTKPASMRQVASIIQQRQWPARNMHPRAHRLQHRERVYREFPQLPIAHQALNDLFFVQSVGLHRFALKQEWSMLKSVVMTEDIASLLTHSDVLRWDGSFAINSAFYLRFLGITDCVAAAIQKFRTIFFTNNGQLRQTLRREEWQAMLYTMTHIIIADSQYYQRFVPRHTWIITFFVENLATILRMATTDICAEVALCFRLTRQDQMETAAVRVLSRHLQPVTLSFTRTSVPSLIRYEHRNSILLLFFGSQRSFWHGPSLQHFLPDFI